MASVEIRESAGGVSFAVHVQPRASRCGVTGVVNGAVKIRLTSPPVEGAANEQCLELVAGILGVRRRDVTIVSGESSRHKTVRVDGVTPRELQEAIEALLPPS